MEINVGEYVRTKGNGIKKIESYNYHEELPNNPYDFNKYHIYKQDITKHSKDIIDLICLGDIIEYQFKTAMETSGIYRNVQIVDYETIDSLKKDDIQLISILTHEQFTKNAYFLEKEV